MTQPRIERDGTLLKRYRRGDHERVWNELRQPSSLVGPYREEALEVARETMRRVLHNTRLLETRLSSRGWRALSFTQQHLAPLHEMPSTTDLAAIRQIEEVTSSELPPSIHAFWEIVGGVNFVWDYNSNETAPDFGLALDLPALDPLCVDNAGLIPYLFEEWEGLREEGEPFRIDLAPDALHKDNVSGGAPYGIQLPFQGADPVFSNEPHHLPFVDYLRLCFRWAGFPDLELHANSPAVQAFVEEMTEGFLSF